MNFTKAQLILMTVSVTALAIILGTFLWLRFAPHRATLEWHNNPLEGSSSYGSVPDFSLIERSGKSVSLAALRGQVWIADFIYTTCTDTCPMQSAEMAKLQEQLNGAVRFVSFSVDPEKDTPAVLNEYAKRFKADAERWLFLTGDKQQISHLIQGGFRLSAAPLKESGGETGIVLHSPRFVLIDKQAVIRGYYDSREPAALKRLSNDTATLLREK